MLTVGAVCEFLEKAAPLKLAESWDNVGLLLGDRSGPANRIMTCLTVSEAVVQEALEQRVEMLVSHHPIPFKPLDRITTDSYTGQLLWKLASAGISVFAPHTAWDNCESGINAQLAELLNLSDVRPIMETEIARAAGIGDAPIGSGRMGLAQANQSLSSLAAKLSSLQGYRPRIVGDSARKVEKVGICCGSGGSLLGNAERAGCDAFLTGEATYHTCLEAEAAGVGMLMIGHHASERFSMQRLAFDLAGQFAKASVWASNAEADPVKNLE